MTQVRHTLPLRTAADTNGVVRDVLGRLEDAGTNIAFARLAANSAAGFRPFVLMTDGLLRRSTVDPKIREVTILRLAARHGADYEWSRHEPAARRYGVTDGQISVLRAVGGITVPTFTDDEVAACALADDLVDGVDIRPRWDDLVNRLGKDEAVDLIFTVAFWGGFVPILSKGLLPLASADSHEEP